jgi:hypothetical protein
VIGLDESLAELLRSGVVSLDAALAVAESPDELEGLAGPRHRAVSIPRVGAVTMPVPPQEARGNEQSKGLLERAGALFGKKGT